MIAAAALSLFLSGAALIAGVFGTSAPSDRAVDYVRDPVAFIDRFLPRNEKGQRWSLSAYQRRVLSLAFRFDASGRLALRLLLWSEPKKSGKTFLAACLVLWWALTRGHSEVVLAANDLDQSVGRVFKTVALLCKHNGLERAKLVKVRATVIACSNGTTISAVAAGDFAGAAGGRQSLTVFDELWAYSSEQLTRFYEEMTPPPSEPDAFVLVVTYAGFTGESKLLEAMAARGLAGERVDPELEVYAAEGGMVTFWSHAPRQPWQTAEYYAQQRASLRPSTYLRLHENRWVSGTEAFIDAAMWAANVDDGYRVPLRPVGPLFVGVDAALKHDTAAVVAVTPADGRVALVAHRIWKPSADAPLDLEATIEAYLRELHARADVREVLCDPWQMARSVATLRAAGVPIREYPQTLANCTRMGQVLFDALKGRQLRLYADDELRAQALNAVAVETPRGWRIAKEKASKKIDAVVALAMACVAAVEGARTMCPYCTDPACDGQPPLGLMDSPHVRAWFATHPDPDEALASGADRTETQPDERRLLEMVESWADAAEADDADTADLLARDIEAVVRDAERRDPRGSGLRLRRLIDGIERELREAEGRVDA